jgi:hypothetical protein
LAELAVTAESDDVGRKWMLQSEREFRLCLSMNERDDYGYQGLSSLFLNWAKRMKGSDEESEFVTKAEEVISEGLRRVKDRDSLWVVSSEVQKWLKNEPSRISKLRTAVAESKVSIIPRYLLGRAYREDGQPEKALEVLDPIIRTNFNEFRSFVEYVRSMLDLRQSYSKCIAILSQAQMDGITDPAYVGLLGGLLFMEGKTGDATKVFDESAKQGFSSDEKHRIQFRPRDTEDPTQRLRLAGRVVKVKPGYVFIQNEKYPDFISTTTRVGSIILQRETKVTFEATFSAKGPYADNVKLA